MSKKYNSIEKERIISAFERRSVSVEEFALSYGVSVGSLYRWKEALGYGFREVEVPVGRDETVFLRLRVGTATLEFSALPPLAYLQALLQTFAGC